MKKTIFFVVLLVCVYSSYSQEQLVKNNKNREELMLLKPYSLYEEVVGEFGEPDDVIGSGFVIIQYILSDGRRINLNFGRGDRLYALVEISILGEMKEIFNCFNESTVSQQSLTPYVQILSINSSW